MTLEPSRQDKTGDIYGPYMLRNGSFEIKKNNKSEKYRAIFTRPNKSTTSLGSFEEEKIEEIYNTIIILDNVSQTPAQFETNFKNRNSKDGEFALYGLSRELFFKLINEI
ncbi:hypothetical protein [uncultured Methanobrevibacter sp.]|uniref:hypothetical protein n=1 Tax=uncultured Methanobrevibacter sp. TaxID=253161 RepID=UPI0025F8919F|nr:hypothetical protein [uncultured Methanobrevibacter sp.]